MSQVPSRVTMLLENYPYPEDPRVRNEAETLCRAGWDVTVVAPRRGPQPRHELVEGVKVRRYRCPESNGSVAGYLLEFTVAHIQLFLRGALELSRGTRVLHLNNPPDTLFPVGLLARALGREVVYDLHDLAPELFAAKFGAPWAQPLMRAVQRASVGSPRRSW